jgi:hypothetical protein
MKFLNYLWDIVKWYLLKSKNTKHTSEIDIVEEAPFMRTHDENEEEVINFNANEPNNNTDLVPVKIYLSHTMNERLGPNDFYMVYEKIEKDTTPVLYL